LPAEAGPKPVPDPSNNDAGATPPQQRERQPGEPPSQPPSQPPSLLLPPPPSALPPAELVPPGEEQLMEEPIIPGEVLPPEEDGDEPPGKIEISPGAKTMQFDPEPSGPPPVPDHLELHDGLSGGHRFEPSVDGESPSPDGLYLVVTVADAAGQSVPLDRFDINAQLSVVVLDPHREGESEARLGRWDFSPEQVRRLVRATPVDGLHIPVAWRDRSPSGDDVIVHVKLVGEGEEMRCQGRVRLEQSVAAANWLPRG
jgi:hypothetical protein